MNAAFGALGRLFSSDGFVPRRVCGLWPDWLVWEHVGGNALILLAYIAMPLMIWRLGVSWPGWRPFKGVMFSFALFIGLCGLGHFLDMLAFYHPMYRLSGHVLVVTGLVSCWTAWSLQRAWPLLTAMKSPVELERIIAERTEELALANLGLREGEARFRQLADAMPHLVWTARPDGHPDYYNERWYALTGQPRGIGGDESWIPVLHPDDVQRSLDVWHRAVETAEPYHIEYRFKDHETGEYRWYLGRALPVKDATGRVVRWFGTCTDIHEERLQAEELRRSEEKFRQLAESIPQLTWIARPDGHIFWYNRRWYEFTGTTPEEMEGWGWQSVHNPATLPGVLERWRGSIAEGKPFEMVFPLRGADGRFRQFLTRVLPTRDAEGGVLGWVGTNTDVDEQKRVEDALRESEARQRRAMAAARLAHWEWDLQSNRIIYQDSLARLFHRSDDRPFADLADCLAVIPLDDHAVIAAAADRARVPGVPYEVDHRVIWPDGSIHWVACQGGAVFDEDGTPLRMVGVDLDITDRKEAEAQIRFLNEGLEELVRERTAELKQQARLIDQAHDAIMIRSTGGVISSWNQGAERVYGWSRQEAVGRVSHELLKTAFPRPLSEIEDELARLGSWDGELIHDRRDGNRVVIASRWVLDRDESSVGEVLEINSDITERKQAAQRLEDSEARTRAILDATVDAIMTIDDQGLFESLNPAAERLFGYPAAELVGQSIKVLMPEPYRSEGDYVANYRATGQKKIIGIGRAFAGLRKDGATFPMHLAVSEFRLGDRRMFTGIARDITKQEEAEEALRQACDEALAATRAKGEFLANMSHEIRTPMNGVVGMTDLLLGTRLDDLQRGYAEAIRGSGEALLTVINDILDFSKIEAGKLTLESVDFDLRSLMEEVADLLAPRARQKDLEIICRVAQDVPARLVGDPVRVRQILTNLAGNAVKFTDRGEVALEAQIVAEDAVEATLRILVRDTGIGIPADRQADVFESFTQVEGGSSRRHGGTGLGLAICQSLVALMGGRIGVESRPGEGSTFWFEVTFAKRSEVEEMPAVKLDGLRVLVVDDQESDREILREMLRSWGCQPEEVASGVEARAKLLADPNINPFRLILLHQDMPGMDGEQTARAIRAAVRYKVPLVMIASPGRSGGAEVEDGLWAARMSKPVRRSRLYNILCRVVAATGSLGHRPPTDEAEREKLLSPLRLLLVEDNEVNRQVAVGMLWRLGCEVEAVSNGREALDALDRGGHDLVLMDVQMPEMDGLAATAAIRASELGTGRHMPIIAMTAHAMQGDRERCLGAGMDDYLSKPIRLSPLREALLAWSGKIGREKIEHGQGPKPEVPTSFAEGLRASCGNDQKLIRKVVDLMLKGVPVRVGRLEAAVVAGDGGKVMAEAHSLKGAFATLGARVLAESCQELMSLGEGGDLAAITEAYKSTLIRWEELEKEATLYLTTLVTVRRDDEVQ